MKLYPWQETNIERWLSAPAMRHLVGDEGGGGKTLTGAAGLARLNPGSALIACPTIMKNHWAEHLKKCWPEAEVGVIRYGKARKNLTKAQAAERDIAYAAPVHVVSYGLLRELGRTYDAVIVDECQAVSAPKTKQTKIIRGFIEHADAALGLSATLIPNEVDSIHGILDAFWPGRFGTAFQFKYRYMESWQEEVKEDLKVWKHKGLYEPYAAELRKRLAHVITRATREEMAEFLPPFDMGVLRVDLEQEPKPAARWQDMLQNLAEAKLPLITEWVDNEARSTSHICLMVYHRAVASRISKNLPAHNVFTIDGTMDTDRRLALIEQAKRSPSAVLVATMKSVGTGVDTLTYFPRAVFAELHSSPRIMEQTAMRFSRLGSEVPSSVLFLIARNTIEEAIASKLEAKFEASNSLQKGTAAGKKLESIFSYTEEELSDAIASLGDDTGGYL